MSKWAEEFVLAYKTGGTVKKLTKEINDARDKKRSQREIDRVISEVIKGKHKRRGY